MTTFDLADNIIAAVEEKRHTLNLFREAVARFFESHPVLRKGNPAAIHSVKSRIKSEESIRGKIQRKLSATSKLTVENVFFEITDFIGVRVLHMLQSHFGDIHTTILKNVDDGEWHLHEAPKAYTWDPDANAYFQRLGIATQLKDSLYTSVHYLVRPRADSPACCEIQVRTLWEEIWGEVDHAINYPQPCHVKPCIDQIRVLARLVATGTRLADSIFSSYHASGPGSASGDSPHPQESELRAHLPRRDLDSILPQPGSRPAEEVRPERRPRSRKKPGT